MSTAGKKVRPCKFIIRSNVVVVLAAAKNNESEDVPWDSLSREVLWTRDKAEPEVARRIVLRSTRVCRAERS